MVDANMQRATSSIIIHSPSSPSFNSYSSSNLADIAARVVQECTNNEYSSSFNDVNFYDDQWHADKQQDHQNNVNIIDHNEKEEDEEGPDDDDEFEFAVVCRDQHDLSADEMFFNGQIKPRYPLFDTNLLNLEEEPTKLPTKPHRLPLRQLFSEETGSFSSSEADDLDGIPTGTYCVWRPKGTRDRALDKSCKKSSSTGTSKRWRFRDLLYRSNSEGKDHRELVFVTPNGKKSATVRPSSGGGDKGGAEFVKKGGGDVKRQTYLPYKQDLVGCISNVNGLSKNLHPF